MAIQNIEMNLYNGTDYTVLNPKTSASQVTYSNTNTSSIITGTNTQTAIDQLFQSVSNGKSSIASAITGKGVSTSSSASFSTIATNIGKIPTGVDTSDATAVASNVLSGKTFYGSSGSKLTGSMTNRGAVSKTLSAGSSYTIPSGYHNGSGSVSASSLSSQTSGTATASDILSGKTAWVNGSKITGTGSQGASYKYVELKIVDNSAQRVGMIFNKVVYPDVNTKTGTELMPVYLNSISYPSSTISYVWIKEIFLFVLGTIASLPLIKFSESSVTQDSDTTSNNQMSGYFLNQPSSGVITITIG